MCMYDSYLSLTDRIAQFCFKAASAKRRIGAAVPMGQLPEVHILNLYIYICICIYFFFYIHMLALPVSLIPSLRSVPKLPQSSEGWEPLCLRANCPRFVDLIWINTWVYAHDYIFILRCSKIDVLELRLRTQFQHVYF